MAIAISIAAAIAWLLDAIARHRDDGREKGAFIRPVFHRNAHRNGFGALETGGRIKVDALLAAMQGRAAFGAFPLEIHIGGKRGRATETARSDDILHESGEFGTGHVERRLWPLRAGAVRAK